MNMSWCVVGGLLSWCVNLIIGVIVYFRNPRVNINKSFGMLSVCIAFWSVGSFLVNILPFSLDVKLWILRICYQAAIAIPALFLWFVHCLVSTKIPFKWIVSTIVCVMFFSIALFTPLFIQRLRPLSFGYLISYPGPIYYFFSLYLTVYMGYGIGILWGSMIKATGILRNQLGYVIMAYIIGTIAAFDYFLSVFQIIDAIPIDDYILVAFFLLLAYAIIRYRLMDIRLVISHAVILAFIYIPLLLIPLVFTFLYQKWIEQLLGNYFWIAPAVSECFLTIIGLLIYREIQRQAEQRLLRKEYEDAKKIEKLVHDLVRFEDIAKLAHLIVSRCREGMGLESAGIYVEQNGSNEYKLIYQEGLPEEGTEKILKDDNMLIGLLKQKQNYVGYEEISGIDPQKLKVHFPWAIALPAFHSDGLLGILILGHKKNRKMYVPVELLTFKMFANYVGFSIASARLVEQRKRLETALYEARSMKELGYLSNTLGHELRNGMQEIASTTMNLLMHIPLAEHMATNKAVETYYMQQIEFINTHILNMSRILDELSRFIRREDPGEMMTVDMQALWKKMIVLIMMRNPEMKHMNVELQGQGFVYGNPVQVQDMLYDMVNNSYDAIMKEKAWRLGKKIDSFYEGQIIFSIKEENDQVYMHLRDNGVGMDERVVRELFIPLFTTKGHNQRKLQREQNLSGTGMYRIKKIIDAQNGTIEVVGSKEHEGTDFLIILPRAQKGA